MPRKIRGRRDCKIAGDGKCHRKDTAGSLATKAQVRLKRRGKSSPLAEQFARQKNPMRCKTKQREGSRPVDPRVSSHHDARKRVGRSALRKSELDEINDRRG